MIAEEFVILVQHLGSTAIEREGFMHTVRGSAERGTRNINSEYFRALRHRMGILET